MLFHWFLFFLLFGLNFRLSQSQHISAKGKVKMSNAKSRRESRLH